MINQFINSILRHRVITLFIVILTVGLATYFYKNRTKYLIYHEIRQALFGDILMERLVEGSGKRFFEPKVKQYSQNDSQSLSHKWRFRMPHAMPTYPKPVVDDTNGDGRPEVYLGSMTKTVHALEGSSGKILWHWKLPFGVVGGRALSTIKFPNKKHRSLVVGTHTSLPIRVYAIDTDPQIEEDQRLIWKKSLHGDFIEGGLAIAEDAKNPRIVALTRDAPYSRGSVNVLNQEGNPVFPPISGVDVCANRPIIADINGDRKLEFVHGSHGFYQANAENKITVRDLETGKLVWQTDVEFDTGWANHVYIPEASLILALGKGDKPKELFQGKIRVLDAISGEIKRDLPYLYQSYVQNSKGEIQLLGYDTDGTIVNFSLDGKVHYRLPYQKERYVTNAFSFAFRPSLGGRYVLGLVKIPDAKMELALFDYETGKPLSQSSLAFDFPPEVGNNRLHDPEIRWPGFLSLVDLDNDDYWEMLYQADDWIYALDTPLPIAEGEQRWLPKGFKDNLNTGELYG